MNSTIVSDNNQSIHNTRTSIRRIAIFRALYLGDMLCIIPAVRAIRRAYPDAEITLIGLSWQQFFVERFKQYFNDFMEFPGWPGLPEQPVDPEKVLQFLQETQQRKFDLVIQMHGDGTFVNTMCSLMGARRVAGLRLPGQYCPEEALFPVLREKDHEILRFLKVVNALGIPLQGTSLEFPVTIQENRNFENLKSMLGIQKGKYICLHPGARDPRRRWAPEQFARVADALADKGYTIVITGSGEEKEVTAKVASLMDHHGIDLVNQAGHIGIGELAVLISHAAALLCNDTGVSHIAAAFETPSVVVFSSYSDPARWAPLNHELHVAITPEQSENHLCVLNAMLDHLEKEHAFRYHHVQVNKVVYHLE